MPTSPRASIASQPVRVPVLLAAAGLALAPAGAMGQGDPLREPFPQFVDIDSLPEGTWFGIGPGAVSADDKVAGVGDVNADGMGDVLVRTDRLPFALVYGRRGGPPVIDLWSLPIEGGVRVGGAGGGSVVGPVGDINGDGIEDFGLGDAFLDGPDGTFRAGRAYVVFGRAGGYPHDIDLRALDGTNGFEMVGTRREEHLGAGIGAAGDLNGDGIGDLLVSASGRLFEGNGSAHIIFGRDQAAGETFEPRILLDEPIDGTRVRFDGGHRTDWHGQVAALGDVNGDGLDDAAVVERYRVFVLFGRSASEPWPRTLDAGDIDGSTGFVTGGIGGILRVAGAGDFNGDGLGDIVMGMWSTSPGGRRYAGMSAVLFGRQDPAFPAVVDLSAMAPEQGFLLEGVDSAFPSEDPGDRAGYSVAGAGDVDGDGFDDVLVSAPGGDYRTPFYGRGEVYLIFGTREPFTEPLLLSELGGGIGVTIHGGLSASMFGSTVARAGDFNGDGRPDMLIGTRRATTPGLGADGGSYVLLGRSVCPADLDGDGALTVFDFLEFQNLFGAGDPRADFDGDGELTIFDFLAFQNAFDAGCP